MTIMNITDTRIWNERIIRKTRIFLVGRRYSRKAKFNLGHEEWMAALHLNGLQAIHMQKLNEARKMNSNTQGEKKRRNKNEFLLARRLKKKCRPE